MLQRVCDRLLIPSQGIGSNLGNQVLFMLESGGNIYGSCKSQLKSTCFSKELAIRFCLVKKIFLSEKSPMMVVVLFA